MTIELLGLSTLIALMLWRGIKLGGVLGALLAVQSVYYGLDYVARPLLLLATRPSPRPADPFADPRLAYFGYEAGLRMILPLVLLGLVAYLLALRFFARRRVRGKNALFIVPSAHAFLLLAVGWFFRLAYVAGSTSATVETLAYLGSLGVGVAVLFSERALRPLPLLGLLVSELAWSALYASKTPILALILWVLVRQVSVGGFRVRRVFPLSLTGAAAFVSIQLVKVQAGKLAATTTYQAAYPTLWRPFLVLLQRFDALQAMTDAVVARPGSWMSPLRAVETFASSLVPRFLLPGGKSDLAGYRWAAEVRRLSLPGSKPSANLAEGPIAEGYVIAGLIGVVTECSLLALLVVVTVRLLQSSARYGALLGLAITSQPLLFERGLLGIGEGIGKGFEIALAASVTLSGLEAWRRAASGAPAFASRPLRARARMNFPVAELVRPSPATDK